MPYRLRLVVQRPSNRTTSVDLSARSSVSSRNRTNKCKNSRFSTSSSLTIAHKSSSRRRIRQPSNSLSPLRPRSKGESLVDLSTRTEVISQTWPKALKRGYTWLKSSNKDQSTTWEQTVSSTVFKLTHLLRKAKYKGRCHLLSLSCINYHFIYK